MSTVRRYTVYFGLVSTVRPATLNAQGFLNSASGVLTSAARAAFALRSNTSRICFVLPRASNLGGGPPDGMMSSSSSVRAFTAHAGSSATSVARRPSVIDLGCGFQEALPSGTRSSTRRVALISSSNSGRSSSASGIRGLHQGRAAKVVVRQRVRQGRAAPLDLRERVVERRGRVGAVPAVGRQGGSKQGAERPRPERGAPDARPGEQGFRCRRRIRRGPPGRISQPRPRPLEIGGGRDRAPPQR